MINKILFTENGRPRGGVAAHASCFTQQCLVRAWSTTQWPAMRVRMSCGAQDEIKGAEGDGITEPSSE